MKLLTVALMGALLLSTPTHASLNCRKHTKPVKNGIFRCKSADYSPNPVNPRERTCIDIWGEINEDIPSNSMLDFTVWQSKGNIPPTKWSAPIGEANDGKIGQTATLSRGGDKITVCLFLPFQIIPNLKGNTIDISVEARSPQDKHILMIKGAMSIENTQLA